jgi:hypothetical protein
MSTMRFRDALAEQRWNDHRYYHHSRINQSLHLVSAICFLCAYALIFVQPAAATLIAWLVAMPSRQIGHFFFEPKGYDVVNRASHEYKERVKVGYNLQRKIVLMSVWVCSPVILVVSPTLFGMIEAPRDTLAFVDHVAILWLAIGVGAVVGRTLQLFYLRSVQAGLVWFTKILTDPLHDVKLYYKSPAYLLRGELFDPIVEGETA